MKTGQDNIDFRARQLGINMRIVRVDTDVGIVDALVRPQVLEPLELLWPAVGLVCTELIVQPMPERPHGLRITP